MLEKVFKILGDGDPAGFDEVLLVNSVGGWLLIIPWGNDYGCGISHIFYLTDTEKEEIEKMEITSSNEIIEKFKERTNLIGRKS